MEIRGTYHDSLEVLHFLKDDVLKGVEHLSSGRLYVLHSLAEDGIGLIEEEYRLEVLALTEVSVGEPGLEGANAEAQVGKKVSKIVITCDKPIAYTGQVLDLTTGKLVGGKAVNSIEIAADMTIKKIGSVSANGFTFKTCLTEEELATAKFKIEMVMETGKTYSAADKTPSSGGIYALTLNEVQ